MNTDDYGQSLDSETIKVGLCELNSGIHFDLGPKHNKWHPYEETRQGVYHNGRHICSMDRGVVPEFKVWKVVETVATVPLSEADKDDATVTYSVIPPSTPGYEDLWQDAQAGRMGHDGIAVLDDGRLVQLRCTRPVKQRGRVIRVGWRHTFERLLLAQIPNITRESLAAKFRVDMWKYPVGGPAETVAAVMED
jgi:hypothetical protein